MAVRCRARIDRLVEIKMTTNAVKQKLTHTNTTVDVYLGVYRMDDLTELCMSFA